MNIVYTFRKFNFRKLQCKTSYQTHRKILKKTTNHILTYTMNQARKVLALTKNMTLCKHSGNSLPVKLLNTDDNYVQNNNKTISNAKYPSSTLAIIATDYFTLVKLRSAVTRRLWGERVAEWQSRDVIGGTYGDNRRLWSNNYQLIMQIRACGQSSSVYQRCRWLADRRNCIVPGPACKSECYRRYICL